MATHELWVPIPGMRTLNWERTRHHQVRARMTKETRFTAKARAKTRLSDIQPPVIIEATPVQAGKGKLADPGGHIVAIKAAVDGLVDARVGLSDDGPEWVRSLVCHAPRRGRERGLVLVVREVEQERVA